MLRVLHIVTSISRGGGLANFIMNYYRNIDRSKIQFDFIYFRESESDFTEEIEALGGRIFKMSEPSVSFSFAREKKMFFKEHRGEWKYIHCHALFAVAVFSKTAKKYGAEAVIAHSHSTMYGAGLSRKIRNYMFVRLADLISDYHFSCSRMAGKFMFKNDKNTVVLKNAISLDAAAFSAEAREKIRGEAGLTDKYVIGHIGGFTKTKNHKMLADVFKDIVRTNDDAVLMLIGGDGIVSGATMKDIVKLVGEYGISDKVRFLGIRKDAVELLSAMDVFVMPSFFEGMPLSCIEAQTNGLPLILSDRITKEIGIFKTEFLSIDRGTGEWVRSINSHYENRRKDLSERSEGVRVMKENGYDIKDEAKKLEKFYLTGEVISLRDEMTGGA